MADGFKIADGYLDIEADVDGALTDVRKFFRKVEDGLEEEEREFKKSGKKSGENYGRELAVALDSKMSGLKPMRKVMEDLDREAKIAAHDIGEHIGHDIERGLTPRGGVNRRGLLSRMFGGLKSGGRSLISGLGDLFSGASSLFSGITKGISSAFSSGVDQAQQIWKNASKFFDQIGSVAGGVGGVLQFGAYAAGIPILLGLAGALLQLSAALLALPAAAGVAVAAIAPLLVAFHGFGEAVSAGFSGDVDKFNEALKKLAPNARKVAKEIVGLKPLLTQLRTSVQEAFFGPLVGQLTKLGNAVLPTLWVGMSHVAGALGRIAAGFTTLLSSKESVAGINNLFMTTERILDTMGPSLINLFASLLRLLNAGLPWVEKFSKVLAGGLQHVADWINAAVAPGGKFTGWMERAWNIGKRLWDVIKGLGQVAFTMLNAFGDEGTDTLRGVADALARMSAYLHSDQGAETLHNLGVIVHWAGNAFVFLLNRMVGAWKALNAFFSFVRGIGPFFRELGHDIADIGRGIGHFFAELGRDVWGGITTAWNAVVGFGKAVWEALVTAWNAVVSFGKGVVDWFVALPGAIGNFFTSLPGMIGSAMTNVASLIQYGLGYIGGAIFGFFTVTLPRWFHDGWEAAKTWTITAMMALIAWANALPGQIGAALSSLGDAIGGWFSRAWEWARNAFITGMMAVIAWANSLPGAISGALSRLGDAIGGWFSRAWAQARNATADGFHSVMNWISQLPGAVGRALSGAGSWLYNVGKDMIRGLINGIGDALSWAVNAARDAANRIKRGFLDALDSHSPSRVMQKEVGRTILPGVVRGMRDTEPQLMEYLGATVDRIRGGFNPMVNVAAPNVSVGGVTLIADLGDGIRQAVPLQIVRNPQVVASAANVGNRQRAAWTNTGRPVITGTGG